MRANPKNLNKLQLRTLAVLQALAGERLFANPADEDGSVMIHTLPQPHGNHFRIGARVVASSDASGLNNPTVMNALVRKGLLMAGPSMSPILTGEGVAYETGIAGQILHSTDH